MSNNSDMIKMLRLVEGQQFAGLPEQRPGDQVRGTEQAKKNGQQHPFHNRLVGEEISLEDKLSKKYQDMKDLHGKDKGVAEEGSENKYSNLSNRGVNRGINRAGDDFNRMMDLDQVESPHYKTQHQQDTKQRLKTKPMAGPKGVLPEQGMAEGEDSKEIGPGWKTEHGIVDRVDGNSVIVKTSQGKMRVNITDIKTAEAPDQGMAEGSQRVDSLVTDALKIMKGAEVSDAISALKTVLGDREYNDRPGFYKFYIKQMLDMYGQQGIAESNMPQSVIKSKQKYAAMTAQEFHAAHKNKSAEELQAMAWRHGYGKGSNHYVDKHKKGSTVTEGRNEIAKGTPDDIKLQIKQLGLGPARRESTGSGGEAIFVFRNPNYYVSQGQDGNWVLVQTNAESDQQGVAEQQLNEFVPLLALGARLFMAAAPKIAQVFGKVGQAGARGVGQAARTGTEIAAKNAGQIGMGAGAYEIGSSVADITKDITAKVGTALDENTIFDLATLAFKYSIPAGIVLAILYGGKKAIDSLFADPKTQQGVAEGQEEIEYICSGCSGSGEGPHEGTTCRTCHGSGVEMGYADEPEHEHDEEELDEDQHESPMERPMLHRIMMRHMDLIEKYGIDRVLDAVRDVAGGIHIGPDDEIGTSDVSAAMVNVMNQLKSSDHAIDENIPAGDINASGSPSTSSGPAPAVSAGGTAPTTPSSTAPAPAATTAPAPAGSTTPGQQQPMTPEEQAALDKIKSNAGLKAQYDKLIQQAH